MTPPQMYYDVRAKIERKKKKTMVSVLVSCEWLKEQLDAGAKGIKVVDGDAQVASI